MAELYATSSFDDHTARLRRALICTGMDAISLPRRKEMAKEKTPGRSPWEPPASRRSDDERRGFLFW